MIRSWDVAPMNGISALGKETPESSLTPLSRDDTVRRRPSTNQEENPREIPTLLNLLVP